MEQHKINKDLAKWELNAENLTAEQLEILSIIQFPKKLGFRDVAQKRIRRRRANNGFIDNDLYNINEVKYNVVNKNVAYFEINRTTPTGNSPQQIEQSREFINGVLRSKSYKHIYIDANNIETELINILRRFGSPTATPSMIEKKEPAKINASNPEKPETPKKPKAKKGRPAKSKTISDEIKNKAIEMLKSGNYDIKETALALGVTQTSIKPLLKTLNDA